MGAMKEDCTVTSEERTEIQDMITELDLAMTYHRIDSFAAWLEAFRRGKAVFERIGALHVILDDKRFEDSKAVEFLLRCVDKDSYDCVLMSSGDRPTDPDLIRAKALNVLITQFLYKEKYGGVWQRVVRFNPKLFTLILKILIQVELDRIVLPRHRKPVKAFFQQCGYLYTMGYNDFPETTHENLKDYYYAAFLWGAQDEVLPVEDVHSGDLLVLRQLVLDYYEGEETSLSLVEIYLSSEGVCKKIAESAILFKALLHSRSLHAVQNDGEEYDEDEG